MTTDVQTPAATGLRIVEEYSHGSGRQATIIVEGDGQEQLASAAARELALKYAATKYGMVKAGISGSGGPYPAHAVLANGTIDDTALMRPSPAGARQRRDYNVTAGL